MSAAVLDASLIALVFLFLAGSPVDRARGPIALLFSQFHPYVVLFVLILVSLRLWRGSGEFQSLGAVRVLRAVPDVLHDSRAVYLVIAGWTLLLIAVAVQRHLMFESRGDLAVAAHGLWNTLHGALYTSSLLEDRSLFAVHFEPLQLALAPVYWTAQSPVTLLVVQAALIALGAVPLYWIARRRLPGHPSLWAIFPTAYLALAPLRTANRFDYHAGALVAAAFLFALYFMDAGRPGLMALFLVLGGLLKENMPAAGVSVGLYLLIARRKWLLGSLMTVGFALWFLAGFAWVIPAFNPGGYQFFRAYGPIGGSIAEIVAAPLLHPDRAVTNFLTRPGWKLSYILNVFGPLAFLPLLSPEGLFLGSPFFAQHLLATSRAQVSLQTHNTTEVVAFVFFGAVLGTARLLSWLPLQSWVRAWSPSRAATPVAILLWTTTALFHGWSEVSYLWQYRSTPRVNALTSALRLVPADVPVAASDHVLPHLTRRERLYWFPPRLTSFPPTDGGSVQDAVFVIVDEAHIEMRYPAGYEAGLAEMRERGYRRIFARDGVSVWRQP